MDKISSGMRVQDFQTPIPDYSHPLTFHCSISGMGTKVQYACNSLALSPATHSFSVYVLDDWDSFGKNRELTEKLRRPRFVKFWDSIDRMLEPHHIECIKKTMLMQENIFQHQVRELHRLYSVQRMLMNELKQPKFWGFDIKNSGFVNFQAQSARDIGPSSGERSGSCSGEMLKMPKGFDLERAAATATATAAHEEDMSTGVSAIDEDQTGPSTHTPQKLSEINIDQKCSDVELTLNIGGSIGEKRSQSHKQNCSLKLDDSRDVDSAGVIKTVKGEEFCDSDNTPMASSSTNFNQKSKHPHWIFQDLSLSRT